MIKKILVPVDGSENSKSALEYAIWMAKKFEAAIIGLNVIDMVALEGPFLHDLSGSLGFEPFLNFSTKMREALEARGQSVLGDFSTVCASAKVACETSIAYGIVPNEICSKANVADIVVMGRRGMNVKFEHGLLGSTTENVLRKSPKSVMIAPEKYAQPKKPLLAYDGSANAGKAMHSAAEWAKVLGLPLTVVTASTTGEQDAYLKEAEDYLKPYGIKAKFVHLDGEPPVAIKKYYEDQGHDLIFMGTSHHSRLVEMVLGSTTEHLMRALPGPFFLER
ncbi:MAG: universal stress protein [Thermodesulfobacteriota bacterium]